MIDYIGRLERLQGLMGEQGVDATVVSIGPDLRYLTGYETHPSERLTALVVRPSGQSVLVVPELEAPKVVGLGLEVLTWAETESPTSMIGSMASRPAKVAIGDHLWSVFLLRLWKEWPHAVWMPASELVGELRIRKDATEVQALRRAGAAVDRAMARIPSEIHFAGRAESDVSKDLARMILEEGHEVAEFAIVASGPNGASPHHMAGERVIEEGDLVVCDFGGRWDGYYSDSTRTFSVGNPSQNQEEVHGVVHAAQEAARSEAGPGVPCEEVDRAARKVIADAGYGEFFIHRTGHGIGLEVHEHPYIVEGNTRTLEPGMAFSIEPGIYLPDRFGVRIEDIVVCRGDGVESLNQSPRGPVVVG